MPWQKITQHISDERLVVESKDGKTYPAEVRYDWDGETVYNQLVSNGTPEDIVMWAWVSFEDGTAIVEDTIRKSESEGYPGEPPWDRGN